MKAIEILKTIFLFVSFLIALNLISFLVFKVIVLYVEFLAQYPFAAFVMFTLWVVFLSFALIDAVKKAKRQEDVMVHYYRQRAKNLKKFLEEEMKNGINLEDEGNEVT
ncbi:MAG: hypothetical protein HPY57_13045 [Ignavibacteria bacterium]|nr:hypothetical protein [Ignavibacteria bacterium]